MRAEADRSKVYQLMEALGRDVKGTGQIYFTGGATAVLLGWRNSTIDVDLKFDPEPEGAFEALPRLKDQLDLNIELASPDAFIPPLPQWRERSQLIGSYGRLHFFHYDFYAQALAKVERGHLQDVADVQEMLRRKLVMPVELRSLFDAILPAMNRYPALEPDEFRAKLDEALKQHELGEPG